MKRTIKIALFSLFSLILLASLLNVKSVNASTQTETKTDTKTNTENILISQTATSGSSDAVYYRYWDGQTFQYSEKFNLTQVSLYVYRVSSPPGDFIVSIRQTSNDVPTGSDLASSSITASSISTSATWYNFSMNIVLNASTLYAIVARCPGIGGAIWWLYNDNVYADGTSVFSEDSGSTWDMYSPVDFCFIVYGFTTTKTLTFSSTISSVNYVKVNGVPWTDYSYSDNTLTVKGLNSLGTYNIEASAEVNVPTTWHRVESWNGILHAIGWYAVETWYGNIFGKCFNLVEVWRGVFPELPMFYVRSVMLYVGLGGLFCFMPLLGFAGKKRSLILLLSAFVLLFISWALLYTVSVTSNF
jgi:hypothetical protein